MEQEINDIVEEVCIKYGYDSEDKEGNDSLKTVLKKAVTVMLKGVKQEDRELFYQMLRNTPIAVTENLNKERYEKLVDQYIGNVNPHIIEEDADLGEYGKSIAAGAYTSKAIISEDMQLIGKKSFIYVQKVYGKGKEFFGTDINVSHLIHELGHAWHAQKDEYTMLDDGTLKERCGTAEIIYSFSKGKDGRYIQKIEKETGLMIEEGMNTLSEEQAMADYMNISLEEMKEKYKSVLIQTNYQGYIANFVQYMLQELNREDFENWRLYGSSESKANIEELMSRTKYWEDRQKDILSSSDNPRNYNNKRQIISRIKSKEAKDFFDQYEDVYFPDIAQMTPLDKIENVLEQYFNMNMMKYQIELDDYINFIDCLGYEGYALINQSADIMKEDELRKLIQDVRLSEFSSITGETKESFIGDNTKEGEISTDEK